MTCNTSLICGLKTRRETLGWSLSKLSRCSGIDETFLGDWEHGLGSPRCDELQIWTTALGLTLELVPTECESRRGVLVDWDTHCIKVAGAPIRLTPMEWKALERLARVPGALVTHQALFRHLYGDDRPHRAQSTAVRVLITKLRRLLPIRIEAEWGQGYVISGLAPAPAHARNGYPAANGDAPPQPLVVQAPRERVAPAPVPMATPRDPLPIRKAIVDLGVAGTRRVVAAPVQVGPRRAEELGVIERFLAERGVTRCPDVSSIQQSPLPTLIWDKVKRKWVRPSIAA
jgi:transcriptional regulator with XRE-family HTH domain